MSEPNQDEGPFAANLIPQRILLPMQIIAAALPTGILFFFGISLFLVYSQPQAANGRLSLTLVALVVFIASNVLAILIPSVQTRNALRRILAGTWTPPSGSNPSAFVSVSEQLLSVRQTTLIVSLAVLEAAGFFCCIAFLIDRHPLPPALVIVTLAVMLSKFPTRQRVLNWLEWQADVLAQMRHGAEALRTEE
jgi:hypothetical protein